MYAECHELTIYLSVVMLYVIMLSVIMLNVVAPIESVLASSVGTVVEHSPHHPKVKGLNPATADT